MAIVRILKSSGIAALCILLPGCPSAPDSAGESETVIQETAAARTQYVREIVFIGRSSDTLVVVPFSFTTETTESGATNRSMAAWLGRGERWERFLHDEWVESPGIGVWRILPRRDLRLLAGGPAEIEALIYRRGERSLRLSLEDTTSGWLRAGDGRYRTLRASLSLGGESLPGTVLESLRTEGGRPALRRREMDRLFLTDGRELRLLLTEGMAEGATDRSYAWGLGMPGERSWDQAQVRWLETRTIQAARREIPTRWSFTIPEGGISGEVEAAGFDAQIGGEGPIRRPVAARYAVEGWMEVNGVRRNVFGVLWHAQE
jgi:hypothetical protein